MLLKKNKRHRTYFISVIIVIVTSIIVTFLTIALVKQASLEVRFDAIVNWLSKVERAVVGLDTPLEIVLCIFALYIAKCQLPIPMGVLCVISGMVFPFHVAVMMNLVFTAFFFAFKYVEGQWIGGGFAMMFLNIPQISFIKDFVVFKGSGNPYILFVSRLVPTIPFGVVSKLYGSMHYDFIKYLTISLLGFAPRLFLYTKIGAAIFNPFSKEFLCWSIVVVLFTGISLLVFNIIYGVISRQMNKTVLIYSQKQKYKIVL